jgi:MYND finger
MHNLLYRDHEFVITDSLLTRVKAHATAPFYFFAFWFSIDVYYNIVAAPMEQGMTVYEGTYCELREPHCASCGVTSDDSPSSRLFQCSRCGVVHYCGVECQKKDFTRHKTDCREVQKCKERMEKEAEPLKTFSQWGEESSNLFETNVGDFWVRYDLKCCGALGHRPRCSQLEFADNLTGLC